MARTMDRPRPAPSSVRVPSPRTNGSSGLSASPGTIGGPVFATRRKACAAAVPVVTVT
jgi:hypothetical protein